MLKEFLGLAELKKMDWQEIERLQDKRFRATLRYVLPHSFFYKHFFKKHKVDPAKLKSVADWKKFGLPLIKKSAYLKQTRDFFVRPQGKRQAIFLTYLQYATYLNKFEGGRLLLSGLLSKLSHSWDNNLTKHVRMFFLPKMPAFAGGTESGRPVPVLLTGRQKTESMVNTADISAYLIISRHFKNDGKDIVTGMNLFPYAPHIAWQIINMAAELRTDLNLCTAAGGFLSTEKLISIAKGASPNVFSGMVDYLINIFLPKAIEAKVRLKGKVVFLNGATKMLEVQREQIKDLFKKLGAKSVVALDGYGASELKEVTLAECEERSGLHHVAPLSSIIRTVKVGQADPKSDYIYDWDFTTDEEGGYAVLWNIDGAGTLLEGYLLGDHYEKIEKGKCPHCGLNVERIYNVNRINDIETEMKLMGVDEEKISGTLINLVALRERLLRLHQLKEVQLVVNQSKARPELQINYVPNLGKIFAAENNIREVFEKYAEVRPTKIKAVKMSDFYGENKLKFRGIIKI